jgi:hypothetical protein
MAGIKNIQEIAALVEIIAVEVCKASVKEGFQVKDLVAFLQAPDFDTKLQAAIDGLDQVPDEAADVGLIEGITLAKDVQRIVYNVVSALKKPAA